MVKKSNEAAHSLCGKHLHKSALTNFIGVIDITGVVMYNCAVVRHVADRLSAMPHVSVGGRLH